MNHVNTQKKVGATTKALCMLSLALACAPAWSGSKEPKFTMTLFSDHAQGLSILDGDYKQAIKKINAKMSDRDRFQVETNLCVAYTKSGELEAAEKACGAALAAAESQKASRHISAFGSTRYVARKQSIAIALSNRGVLKAVKGDFDSARQDFDAAIGLHARLSAPKTNLERLEIAVASANRV